MSLGCMIIVDLKKVLIDFNINSFVWFFLNVVYFYID